MALVKNTDIRSTATEIQVIDRLSSSKGLSRTLKSLEAGLSIVQYDASFADLIGTSPTHSLLLETENPLFHEAAVFLPDHDELYLTSNLLQPVSSSKFPTILISRVKLYRAEYLNGDNNVCAVDWAKMRPPPGIDMPNGGVNYKDGIIFCAQGSNKQGSGGLYFSPRSGQPARMVTNFQGRDFNSVNDVVVAKDGCIWFTDPIYGYEQGFRSKPMLPNQVYRFDPQTGNLRVVADGFGRPNGICFSPDESTVYITDTDLIHGDGSRELSRPASIYAFDVQATAGGAPFLVNRRLFAFAAEGFPDGIKCDVYGNVYSGCSDGVEVWNPSGELIGIILIPGGVANFCFGKEGEMFCCAERKLWRVQLARSTRGALLGV